MAGGSIYRHLGTSGMNRSQEKEQWDVRERQWLTQRKKFDTSGLLAVGEGTEDKDVGEGRGWWETGCRGKQGMVPQ